MFNLSILIFIVWLILNSKISVEVIIFGVMVIFLVIWLASRITPKAYQHKFPIAKFFKTLNYIFIVVWEVILANIDMIKIVLFVSEKDLNPSVTKVSIDLENNLAITALTSSITLTPGTITVAVSGNDYYIHALDKGMLEGTHESIFVNKLKELEDYD